MKPVFSSVKSSSANVRIFKAVIDQIQDMILTGQLNANQKLPSERELQKMMQVSRGTIREALRVLEDRELIEIKAGRKGGIFVKP